MLSNNTATFSRSRFAPQYSSSELIDGKYILRNHLESDEISRLYTARHVDTKEFVHIRIFTGYFSRFISDEPMFLEDREYFSKSLGKGQLKIIDKGLTDDSFYIVWPMERLESLNELVKKIGPIQRDDALIIINETLNYLKNAYSKYKEPHLSIGGSNIYVNAKGEVRFSDYGISTYMLQKYPFFNIKCFHEYVAPELNRNAVKTASRSSDIFLLACILFKMVTGRTPAVIGATNQYRFDFIQPEIDRLGSDFMKIFARMSAPSPERRLKTYSEVQSAVQSLLLREQISVQDEEEIQIKENEIITLGSKKFIFSEDFQHRMEALRNVADFIRSDSSKKEGRYIYKYLFYAILLLFSTFIILVKFTIEKI